MLMARTPFAMPSSQPRVQARRGPPAPAASPHAAPSPEGLRVGAEAQPHFTEFHEVSIIQVVRLLFHLVDDDAVATAEVRDHEAPIVRIIVQEGMAARNGIVEQADVVVAM